MKKISLAKDLIKKNDIFICPVCRQKMALKGENSLLCLKGHCFDLARRGYVNLLAGPVKNPYSKELFASRSVICKSGFYRPMIEKLSHMMAHAAGCGSERTMKILDAGCGEGSHLAGVTCREAEKSGCELLGVGIDISREAIDAAARDYPGKIWCAADLARLPFAGGSFDVVLNILSPANYGEFRRVLKEEGILIKVMPGSGYLQELRALLYRGTNRQTYANEEVVRHLRRKFEVLEKEQLLYSTALPQAHLPHLAAMTPLSWGQKPQEIKKALSKIEKITVDLTIVVARCS